MRMKATKEFYSELEQFMLDVGDLNDGIFDIYFLPSIDGKLFLVNSRTIPLGYKYIAVYKMKTGQVEYYKTDVKKGDDKKCNL